MELINQIRKKVHSSYVLYTKKRRELQSVMFAKNKNNLSSVHEENQKIYLTIGHKTSYDDQSTRLLRKGKNLPIFF